MKAELRSVLVLLIAVVILMIGNGPLTTLVSVRLEAAGTSTFVVGIVMAAYFAGLTLGSLFGYRLITAIGHIRAYAVFVATMSAAGLVYPIALDPLLWGGLRLLQGFCMAGLFICIESWLNDSASSRSRGSILATYMTCLYIAQSLGQFILVIPDATGYLLFVLIAIFLNLSAVPVALSRMAPPMLPNVTSLSFRRLYQASPLGIFGTLSSGFILGAVYSLAPVYASGWGLDLGQTALFMSAFIFGGVLLQWPLGWLSDLLDRRKVIVGVIIAGALSSAAMLLTPGFGEWAMVAAVAVFGGVAFVLYPLCVAHTNDHLSREERISATGGLILSYSAGATVGPPIAAAFMSGLGPNGLFVFTGLIGILSIAFASWRLRARGPVPADLQGPFQTLPRTTPVAAPLDPRGEAEVQIRPVYSHSGPKT